MKAKLIAAIAVIAAAVFAVACSHAGRSDQSGTPETTEKPAEDVNVSGWFDYGTALYLRDSFTPGDKKSIEIQMAQNEKEGFEYIVVSDGYIENLRVELPPLSDGSGNTISGTVYIARQIYVNIADLTHKRGYTPEVLLAQDDPYQGGSFYLKAGRAKTVYVQFVTDKNTVPGLYSGTLELKQGETVLLSGEVSVNVRDVYCDDKTECLTFFDYRYAKYDTGFGGPGPDSAPDMDDGHYSQFVGVEVDVDKAYETRQKYVDYMLDNRLSPATLPLKDGLADDIELVRKYMDNPRLTLTGITGGNTETQAKIAADNGWFDKVSVMVGDEPTTEDALRLAKEKALLVSRRTGITKMTCAFGIMYTRYLLDMDPILAERMSEFTTFYCPDVYTAFGHQPTLDFMHRMREEQGATLFWYDAGPAYGDTEKRPHILTCASGLEKRIIFWQQYMLDIDGFLYYHTTKWNQYLDFWDPDYEDTQKPFPKPGGVEGYEGGGVLMYWHPVTQDPVGSLTLESVRDGIEDFQLMRMAERAVGRDEVMKYVNRITTGHTEFTSDGDLFEKVRSELFEIVEKAQTPQPES